ncbi:MAG TPA: DinB family protein, partial [Ktedonobacteraceae bacterium]|nr:DinB family protein [Ktedonobacteraceae bacterium]
MSKDVQERFPGTPTTSRQALAEQYQQVRHFSERLCEPLATEDYVIQSMPDVSPTKWHLAHVTWFWETFLLSEAIPGYKSLHPQYAYLFNSYYNSLGARHSRPNRGLLSRPTVEEVYHYRRYVDQQVLALLEKIDEKQLIAFMPIIILGMNHEQQHQELILTDIKHVLSCNPLHPAYITSASTGEVHVPALEWIAYPEGIRWIGHEGESFFFDNEEPRHR